MTKMKITKTLNTAAQTIKQTKQNKTTTNNTNEAALASTDVI